MLSEFRKAAAKIHFFRELSTRRNQELYILFVPITKKCIFAASKSTDIFYRMSLALNKLSMLKEVKQYTL